MTQHQYTTDQARRRRAWRASLRPRTVRMVRPTPAALAVLCVAFTLFGWLLAQMMGGGTPDRIDREDNRRAIDYVNRERRGVPEGAGPIVWGCFLFLGLIAGVLSWWLNAWVIRHL